MRQLTYIFVFLFSLNGYAQDERKYIREGNEHYENKDYEAAVVSIHNFLYPVCNSGRSMSINVFAELKKAWSKKKVF